MGDGWKKLKLVELMEYIPTGVANFNDEKSYFSTGSINNGIAIAEGIFTFSNRPSRANRLVREGDLLQARMKATNKAFIVDDKLDNSLVSTGFIQLRAANDKCDTKYVYYFLNSDEFLLQRDEFATGSTQEALTDKGLKKINIPLPPTIDEQRQIVLRLEALLSGLNNATNRLEKIPYILRRFRQSVLSAACSGRLTADWREGKNLPEWEYPKAQDVCYHITKGETPKNSVTKIGDVPFLKVYNIRDNKLDFNYDKSFISLDIHEHKMKRSQIFPNDIIMNIVGPPLQKVAIIPQDFKKGNINQAIAIFRAKEKIFYKYIYFVLLCEDTLKSLLNETRGTAGQSNLSLEQCRNLVFPLPPLPEQEEIVRRVDALFALADNIEQRYNTAKSTLARAEKAVYKKAFSGEL